MIRYVNANHHFLFLQQNPPFHKNYDFKHVTENLIGNGTSQLTFTCSNSTNKKKTLEKGVKHVQSFYFCY